MPGPRTLLGLLPFVAFVLSAALCGGLRKRLGIGRDLREAAVVAAVACGVWVAIGTEILSLGRWLTPSAVLGWWLGAVLALGIGVWRLRARLADFWTPPRALSWGERTLALLCFALVLLAAIPAILSPPNNWDALAYHLPRQVFWIENRTVAHYSTNDSRELIMPPLGEFFGAHLMLLSATDRWANLVQWFALVLTMTAASLVARDLGGGRLAQALAAFLVIANPLIFVQASSPKNDLLLGLWGSIAAWLVLRTWKSDAPRSSMIVLLGAAFGLLFLTKATALVLALPIGTVLAGVLVARRGARVLAAGAAMAAIVLSLNLGHLSRNWILFGSAAGPRLPQEGGYAVTNEIVSWRAVASNLARNAALHVGTPESAWNHWLTERFERLDRRLGQAPGDPRTTFPAAARLEVRGDFFNEDSAPAPLHLLLVVLLPAALASRSLRRNVPLLAYLALPYASFLILCALLKWQPWNARFHASILCLVAAPAALLLASAPRLLVAPTVALGLAVLLPSAIYNHARPLAGDGSVWVTPRLEQMFRNQPALRQPTESVVALLGALRPARIGLKLVGGSDFVYDVQRMILDRVRPRPALLEFNPNWGKRADRFDALPDLVVASGTFPAWLLHRSTGVPFAAIAQFPPYMIYAPEDERGRSCTSCSFFGWKDTVGLDALEGPYPQWDLPAVRWGLGPRTRFFFESRTTAVELVMEARRNETPDQTVTVVCNKTPRFRFEFGSAPTFQTLRVALEVRQGWNEIELGYGNWPVIAGRPLAVLFRKLQIVPGERISRDPNN